MVDRLTPRVNREGNGHQAGDVTHAPIRHRADTADAVQVLPHAVAEHALVVGPASARLHDPHHRLLCLRDLFQLSKIAVELVDVAWRTGIDLTGSGDTYCRT